MDLILQPQPPLLQASFKVLSLGATRKVSVIVILTGGTMQSYLRLRYEFENFIAFRMALAATRHLPPQIADSAELGPLTVDREVMDRLSFALVGEERC